MQITLRNPFDAHGHLRNRLTLLYQVIEYSIRQFSGMIVMPNVNPYLTTLSKLLLYRHEVTQALEQLAKEKDFLPCFTFYLSTELFEDDLLAAWENKYITGLKSYPMGATTGSDQGLGSFWEVRKTLEVMEKRGIPLLIHGETPQWKGEIVDDFEREMIFVENELTTLVKEFPALKISLEHISTKAAVDFVLAQKDHVVATVTPGHCSFDRRAIFNGITKNEDNSGYRYDLKKNGVHPSMVMRPILKHRTDVLAIQNGLKHQALHGLKKFGLGTDTAPHTKEKKYCECGACGMYWAPIALEQYATTFEYLGILDHLSTFACDVMPEFYGIKDSLPEKTITLERTPLIIQEDYNGIVTPNAGLELPWSVIYKN